MEILEKIFGSSSDLTALQMSARAFLIFILTLFFLRLSGRRSLGHRSAFDLCITVLLGAVLSRAIVGASPMIPTLCAGATLVILHRVIAFECRESNYLDDIINGSARTLVYQGKIDRRQMRAGLITDADLFEAVQKKIGKKDLSNIEKVILERNGEMTVIPLAPGSSR